MEKPMGLGQWPNAPLAYVIAEIKFQRVQDFEAQLPALTEQLADRYPLEESSSTLEISGTGSPPSMESLRDFKNFSSTVGVRLTRGSLSLHCTDYAGSSSFQSEWFHLLDLIARLLKPRVLLRSSLRCVDLLVPQGDESPDHYLVPSLRPWCEGSDVLGEFEQGNMVSRFKYQDLSTTVLILARIKGQFVLPPTLAAMSLTFSPVQAKALQFHQSTGRPFAIMDTDVAHEAARQFDLGELKAQFKQIHQLASASFRAATTVEAQQFWQTP
jgi:uncharacterized protein (TIGR04255 family)